LYTHLHTEEVTDTRDLLFKLVQQEHFLEAFRALNKAELLSKEHPFKRFVLSQSSTGMLLLTTRIRELLDNRQPRKLIPLTLKSKLTHHLLSSLHRKYLHPGTNTLLAIVGETYHIPGIKNHLKKLSCQCPQCQRAYDRGTQQAMGLLPTNRTTPSPPFSNTELDFAGPFLTKRGYTRKPTIIKAYTCIFMCFSTKAVHIELCLDLTTCEFMAALRRFCSRRGTPKNIYSDNGTNFVGANSEFKRIEEALKTAETAIHQYSASNSIQWHFIPPRTPHMGGLWEAAVCGMKRIMRKILQSHLLKVDELSSILIEIEASLNSRPLIQMESTDSDSPALTPGHFLIGRPLLAPPTPIQTREKITALRRWQLMQRLSQDFWDAWKTSYLHSIQQRHVWNGSSHKFKEGDIVFLKEDIFSYRQWPLAKILKICPGDDGVTRVAKVLCNGKEQIRAVSHMIPLLNEEGQEEKKYDAASTSPRPPSLFMSSQGED